MIKAKGLRQAIGFALSLVCLGVIATRIHWAEVGQALAGFHTVYLIFGVASLAFGYAMRILRWSVLLRADNAKITPLACAAPFIVSITLNNILPFRAGDVVRALVFPTAMGVRRVTATASLVLERLIDLLSLLLCLGVGLALAPSITLPESLKNTVSTLSIVGSAAILAIVLFRHAILRGLKALLGRAQKPSQQKALELAVGLFTGLATMSRASTLAICAGLSALVWLGEAGLFFSVLAGFDLQASLPAALIVMTMSTLSTLVPSAPGYVGTFHMAAFAAVTLVGADAAAAASFAIIAHFILWVSTTLPGAIAAALRPDLFRKTHSLSAETP